MTGAKVVAQHFESSSDHKRWYSFKSEVFASFFDTFFLKNPNFFALPSPQDLSLGEVGAKVGSSDS